MEDKTRFADCAAAYGHDRARWPGADQQLYDRYASTEWGRAVLADAESIDHYLNRYQVADVSPSWQASLGAIAETPPPLLNRRARIAVATAFACIALVGFLQGGISEWRNGASVDEQALLGSLFVAMSGAT
jgi:hypothetical protein